MNPKLLYFLAFVFMLCSCDSPQLLEEKEYSFFIFRYTNYADRELIITTDIAENGIYLYPKRYRNEPYFCLKDSISNKEKYTFDICELATEEKLLALHGDYYTYFPYTSIQTSGKDVVRDGNWDKVCDGNPLDLPIIGNANTFLAEIRVFEIRPLEKITGKSRNTMSIEDIEKAINKVIDEGNLDKYSTQVSNFWPSYYR